MSTDELTPESIEEAVELDTAAMHDKSAVDPILASLVEIATMNEASFGVTLALPGSVLTGIVIGVREYFRLFAAQWEAVDTSEEIVKGYLAIGEASYNRYVAEKDKPVHERIYPPFLHLKDARYVMGAHLVPHAGPMLWRGLLSEVKGFSLGSMSESTK